MRPFLYLLLAPVFIAMDQLSKWFVTEILTRTVLEKPDVQSMDFIDWLLNAPARLPYVEVEITPFFNQVMVWNQGVSFGLFNQGGDQSALILSAISALVSVFFIIWLFRTPYRVQAFGIIFVVSGALGNVIDRLRFGAVIDFLDFHVWGYHWPSFNLADSFVFIGITILIIHSLFFEKSLHE